MVTGCLPRVVMVTGYLHRVVSVTGFIPKVMMVAGCLPRVVMVTGFLPKIVMVTGYLPWASALHSEWSDRVAQLLERRIQDPKSRGSNPVRSTRKNCESFYDLEILY